MKNKQGIMVSLEGLARGQAMARGAAATAVVVVVGGVDNEDGLN